MKTRIEKWKCTECITYPEEKDLYPCLVQIHTASFENLKMGDDQERFKQRHCLCNNIPDILVRWKRVDD